MKAHEELKLILSNMHSWNLALFYSDEEVQEITTKLYQRWEEQHRVGEPIDYATDEEARRLLMLAKKYSRIPPWQAYRMLMARMLRE